VKIINNNPKNNRDLEDNYPSPIIYLPLKFTLNICPKLLQTPILFLFPILIITLLNKINIKSISS